MANRYLDFKREADKKFNEDLEQVVFFAFGNAQFEEGCRRFGIDPKKTSDELYALGGGGYYRKTDTKKLAKIFADHELARVRALKEGGVTFAADMFEAELANHEYCLTRDLEETLDALGYTADRIQESTVLKAGLQEALRRSEYYTPAWLRDPDEVTA